jgi:AraC-like DNA-binding protein
VTPFILVDLLLRGASIGLLALLALRLLTLRPVRFLGLSFALLAIVVIDYVLVSAPMDLVGQGALAQVLIYIPVLVPFLLWWAGMAMFVDHFRPRLWHGLLALAVFLPVPFLDRFDVAELVRVLVSFALYGHLIYVAVRTGSGDLLEVRRRFRFWFILAAVVFAGLVQWFELSAAGHALPATTYPVQPLAILALVLAFAFWALRAESAIWQAGRRRQTAAAPPKPDAHLLQRLKAEMEGGIWRQEGLTVANLAARMEIPAHRLRVLINGALGYRNFSAFVNERRIAAACAVLADPAQAGTPVLSVAYDVGFASIGPFNRAFREAKGESPSAYRARMAAKPV